MGALVAGSLFMRRSPSFDEYGSRHRRLEQRLHFFLAPVRHIAAIVLEKRFKPQEADVVSAGVG